MRLPVRVVCMACLQSLEVSSDEDISGRSLCPYCGHSGDLRPSDSQTRSGDGFASPPPVDSEALTPLSEASSSLLPGRIGRFVLREPLGEGGYGRVFRAYDPHLERDVALKILKPDRLGKKALERFYREARAAARLDHPNIVGLHDAGRDADRCWIAYQLVPGQTLSTLRDLDRPSVDATVRIVRDLALALDHAHGRGVFHRDLKPANVLIDDSGRPRLTDFGLARRGDLESDLTQEGTVLGTPQYMSPEAAAGRAHAADGRSDLYSLGVIFYELICGKRPADMPTNAPSWRARRPSTPPPTPCSVDQAISPEVDRICMKALAFDPEARYPDARTFADALTRYLRARSGARPQAHATGKQGLAIGTFVVFSALCLALGISLQRATQVGATAHANLVPLHAGRPPAGARPSAAEAPPALPALATSASSGPAPPKVPAANPAPIVVLNTETRRFHTLSCRSGMKIVEGHRSEIAFPDEATVAAKFLKPCELCKPTLEKTLRGIATAR